MKVYLIDGTFELFRCFYGAPRTTSADGREVGAVRGMLYTLVSLLRQPDVTHVAVAFDQMTSRSRGDGAASNDALLRSQYMPAADGVRALGITVWPMHRFQADDALATAASRFKREPAVEQVVICTTDKDLTQSVDGERVVLLDRIRKRLTTERDVYERYGVPPPTMPEFFALVGDPSDGLPGVPGWGAKSAAAVLRVYDRVEAIPDDEAAWTVRVRGAAALAASLRERRREAILMRNLSILRTDIPIPDQVADLEWRGADRAVLGRVAARVGAEEIMGRVPRWRAD